MTRSLCVAGILGLASTLATIAMPTGHGDRVAGYAPSSVLHPDTNRTKPGEHSASDRAVVLSIPGYLSFWGLPPVPGQFILSDSALTFQSAGGTATSMAARFSLAYIDRENGRIHYLFRVEGGVFETDAPGALLDVLRKQRTALAHMVRASASAAVGVASPTASLLEAQRIAGSHYADTLYHLFGRPRAAVGLIGPRGRAAGRLGEYIARRDSLALDPGRMMGEAQLRHALAHELGHRWQGRFKAELATLWSGVPGIRDPRRYGYGEKSEHQAEALAFAINFLQTTAAGCPAALALSLLDHYELLVPGTRVLAGYLARQPIYRRHPLRALLTGRSATYALAR